MKIIVDERDEELERIRKKKLMNLMKEKGSDNMALNKKPMPAKPIEVSDSNFDETIKKYPLVVVDCWASWCMPCRMVGPVIEELAKDHAGKIVYGKLNVDENQKTSMKYGIMSIPTMLIFKGGELVDLQVGAMPKEMLEPAVTKFL